MAIHSSSLACKIPWAEEPDRLQSMVSQRVGHDWTTSLHFLSSVQFSHSVMFNSLWPHELQHSRLPCPKPTPGAYSDSCPEYSGLISFRMDWLDLLAVQGTLKGLLQHHSSKSSILWCSAFFIVQLSHPYMTTGKTIALTRWTFVDKVMSLLFNKLSSLVITFLPRSECLFISWLQHHLQWFWSPRK